METTSIKVLNEGFITLVSAPHNADLIGVNAARVSFDRESQSLTTADKRLINFLIKNKHDSPFRHVHITCRIKAPEFVIRQWYKHVIGIAYTPEREPDHAWNEISGRYVEYEPEFYYPEKYRKQSLNNKQATTDEEIDKPEFADVIYRQSIEQSYSAYKGLLELGVGREIARTVLPLNFYTKVIWTASLQAMLNFIMLRDHEGAQHEIRLYAQALRQILEGIVPVTMAAWLKHRS